MYINISRMYTNIQRMYTNIHRMCINIHRMYNGWLIKTGIWKQSMAAINLAFCIMKYSRSKVKHALPYEKLNNFQEDLLSYYFSSKLY